MTGMIMVPRFLQQLELDTSADERAIRRAYAQKLKKIDQEADPAGFQALRAAYDAALMWARQPSRSAPEQDLDAEDEDEADAAPSPAPTASFAPPNVAIPKLRVEATSPPPAAAPVPVPTQQDDAAAHANTAFAGFMDTFKAAAANPKTMPDYHTWQAALEKIMAGDALISMTARELFEYKFAALLTQGWKPGHEALLVAATNVFRWNEDRRHLQSFGNIGFVLDRALQERALFDRLPPKDRAQQRALIQRLRNPSEPNRRELQDSFLLLENTVRNFPTWLGIITDVSQLPRWRELYAALPPSKRGKQVPLGQLPQHPTSTGSRRSGWWMALLLVILVNGARLLSNGSGPQPTVSSGQSTIANKLLAPTDPMPVPPPTQAFRSDPVDPRHGRQPPPPLSQKAVAALVKKAPSPEVCDEVFRITQVYDLDTPYQSANPGPAFDRQIVACVAKRHWPMSMMSDVSVQQALRREKARLAANNKKLQADIDHLYLRGDKPNQPPSAPAVHQQGVFKESTATGASADVE
ncbi:hypothetical protein K6V18_19765 [Ralstonia insidiosa]|uniref:hypothetical protein n=1 Tax=Ralstonia TaxID=48736 RepID=UPI00128E4BDD|nr:MULTISPECIES: hypothetical protein [Ralstonia]MBY4707266.1 hypothetical protein [Ralstonia insidiosa]